MFKVITSEQQWALFLRRAKKHFPKEYCEALWGISTLDSFRITDFRFISADVETKNTLEYTSEEIKKQQRAAKAAGKEFLGTIHTHPSRAYDTSASTVDHHEAAKDGERLMGIVQLHKKGRKFVVAAEWWFPQPKIEFELVQE
jgi:hypothetical protein